MKNASTTVRQTSSKNTNYAKLDEDGNIIINLEDVTEDKVSFIKYSEDSKIELLARKGEDEKVHVAYGTCNSCNGSPKAYYKQSVDELQCNNCGLTFPLDVIGVDGTGCHPIKIDEDGITTTETGVVIDKNTLFENEALFSNIVSH